VSTSPYRMEAERLHPNPYAKGWAANRWRWLKVAVVFLTWVPAAVPFMWLARRVTDASGEIVFACIAVPAALGALAFIQVQLKRMRCPRCGKNPYRRGPRAKMQLGPCVYCGLSR